MDVDVTGIAYAFPDRAARAAATHSLSRKAPARIVASCEDGADRTLVVPPRVARQLAKDEPALPLPYAELRARVFALEDAACFATLVEMLSRRDHATGEVRRKLTAAGYRADAIEAAIARATSARYLNDQRFASYFIGERLRRGWGRRKIERELVQRGIVLDEIPGYPDAFFSDDDDAARAAALLAKRRVPEIRPFEKLVRHLMGKGFSYDVAARAARERIAADEDA